MGKIKEARDQNPFIWLYQAFKGIDVNKKTKLLLSDEEVKDMKEICVNHIELILNNPDVLEIEPKIATENKFMARQTAPVLCGINELN